MDLGVVKGEFISESRDLLQVMEAALLRIANEPDNDELINDMFRAAHTIKGNAGVFGFDHIVSFTHVAESVLDEVRSDKIAIDDVLAKLLLSWHDHLEHLISRVADDNAVDADGGVQQTTDKLKQALQSYLAVGVPAETAVARAEPASTTAQLPPVVGRAVNNENWHVSVRYNREVLRQGLDPLAFLRYMQKLGDIRNVLVLPDEMPSVDEFDAEQCYLGFEIALATDRTKTDIENVFSFVREDCTLHILPPRSMIADYAKLIETLGGADQRVGQMLVACGALTEKELDDALNVQAAAASIQPTSSKPLGAVLVEQKVVHKEVVDAALMKQQREKERKTSSGRSIRVDADKLDHFINLIGELVISGASAGLMAQQQGDDALVESVSVMTRLVDEIRDAALRLRMVPIGETFNRFQRVVHDISAEIGKEIRLEIAGADTELDKSVVEKIADPLTHLVRNGMDHGIEAAAERVAAGKSAQGTLKLNAYHDSGLIVIEVTDDGRGLNRDKILNKAIEKGMVTANHGLSDQEIYRMIFAPGFSTAEAVTNLSGRGVGMDVVRRNIEALRGSIELESVLGQGTTVRIRLPLTLAIIDSFLVRVANATYVIPLDMVVECIEPDRQSSDTLARSRSYLNLRGEVLPYLRLRQFFRLGGGVQRRESIVVVRHGDRKIGLVVDELLGESQTVIKALGKLFVNLRGISGSTIMGSGEVALIIDVPALITQATSTEAREVSAKDARVAQAG